MYISVEVHICIYIYQNIGETYVLLYVYYICRNTVGIHMIYTYVKIHGDISIKIIIYGLYCMYNTMVIHLYIIHGKHTAQVKYKRFMRGIYQWFCLIRYMWSLNY